jgi:putative ABC transport system permease protein
LRRRLEEHNQLPIAYQEKVRRIPGVAAVTHINWFGGIYQDEKNFFPQQAGTQ